jgi:hypothetical protein
MHQAHFIKADFLKYKYSSDITSGKLSNMIGLTWNNSLQPTAKRVTLFAAKAKLAPRYGGLVPPLDNSKTIT